MDRRSLGFPLLLILCIGVPAWVWFQRRDKEPEQIVPDGALKAGEWLAEFELINDLGHPIQMNFPRGRKGTVLFFWHVQCPAVLAVHPRFEALMERYKKRGFEFVVIDSEPSRLAGRRKGPPAGAQDLVPGASRQPSQDGDAARRHTRSHVLGLRP